MYTQRGEGEKVEEEEEQRHGEGECAHRVVGEALMS